MIYRVDISRKKVFKEKLPEKYRLMGGRGLTSKILLDEVEPTCDPLGPKNKLIIAPGLLGGTSAPSSGRLSIGGKSPLTGGIKESNGGGTAAQKLARLGIKALIIEGKPGAEQWYSLVITNNGIEILSADEIVGSGNYETVGYYQNKYGKKTAVISIGPAGENQYRAATIAVTNIEGQPSRHCARGGLGALMGSKKIKAIIIDDADASGVKIEDENTFKYIAKEWSKALVPAKKVLTEYGTANLVEPMSALGCLPTNNFSSGSFEKASEISGNKLRELLDKRGGKHGHPCHPGCVIRCSNVYNDDDGNYVTSGFEYETIGLMGSNCGISNLDIIAKMDRFCDDIGLDTMEMGVTLGVIMESGLIPFGDGEKALEILKQAEQKTILGRLIGQGAGITGRVLGVNRIPTVKNQGISSYDPRGLKGTGVTYATSPQGADHTAGNCLPGRGGYRPETSNPGDVQKPEGQAALSRDIQIMTTVCDYAGLCFFVGANLDTMKLIAKLINAQYGTELSHDDVIEMGIETLKVELEFNRRAGFTSADDILPEFFYTEKLPPKDLVFDVSREEVRKTLDF